MNFIKNKKASELSLETIAIFIIVAIVLIVVIYFFSSNYTDNTNIITNISNDVLNKKDF